MIAGDGEGWQTGEIRALTVAWYRRSLGRLLSHHDHEPDSRVQNWGFSETIVPPAWSLSVEFAAYLGFPIMLWLARDSRPAMAAVIAVVCVAALAWVSGIAPWNASVVKRGPLDVYWGYSSGSLIGCFADFMLGVLVYQFRAQARSLNAVSSNLLTALTAAAMVILACLEGSDLLIGALSPILVVGLATRAGVVAGLLGKSAALLARPGLLFAIPDSSSVHHAEITCAQLS